MISLTINKETNNVIILSSDVAFCLGTLEYAFGNLIYWLENDFEGIENSPETIFDIAFATLKDAISNLPKAKRDISEYTKTLFESPKTKSKIIVRAEEFFYWLDYLSNDKISLSLQDVDLIRVHRRLKHEPFPKNYSILDKSVDFSTGLEASVNSISQIFYYLLFWYAYNNLKLVKCEHCGRWFATDSFKNKYCTRKTTFPGYEHLPCEQAVRNIRQRCERLKNGIETKARGCINGQLQKNENYLYEFWNKCGSLHDAPPTVHNLQAYLEYLKEENHQKNWLK